MAFPLYLTAVWLAWVLVRQTSANTVMVIGTGSVLIALALWLYGRPTRGRISLVFATLALFAALALLRLPALTPTSRSATSSEAGHEAWSPERVASLRAEGRTVFVDFTADWCITCKVNERGALASDTVREAFASQNVATLVADWTHADPAITAELARFGRNGVPLYLVYPQGGEPRVLPQVLTAGIVVDALKP
jgi:thiol:disulfide interchange protein DsbD